MQRVCALGVRGGCMPSFSRSAHPHLPRVRPCNNHANHKRRGRRQPIPYFETSAKDATRVEGAFLEAAQLALQQTATQDKDE